MDITRATAPSSEATETINDLFSYHAWDEDQKERGERVRRALALTMEVIIETVPPCPDRSAAIRKLREVRMDLNSAITHKGKY